MTHSVGIRRARSHRSFVRTLPQLLTAAVESDPDAIAVVVADSTGPVADLTYAELDAESAPLARLLIQRGIGSEDLVAVAAAPSLEAVIAVWAVAQTGAADRKST